MKKKFTILTTAIIILISFKTQGQDTKEYVKSYFGLIGGVAIPLGDFSKAIYNNNNAGFAKKGMVLGVNGAYYFYKNLAFAATLSYQDLGELTQDDAQTLANGYNSDFKTNSTSVTTANRYNSVNIMGGPQYSFVYHKFIFDVRAAAGFIKSFSTPSTTVEFTTNNTYTIIGQNSSKATAFAYGAGAGVRFSLGDNWDVNLRGNYIQSDGLKITNQNNTGSLGRFQTKQPISEIQTTIGISLHL